MEWPHGSGGATLLIADVGIVPTAFHSRFGCVRHQRSVTPKSLEVPLGRMLTHKPLCRCAVLSPRIVKQERSLNPRDCSRSGNRAGRRSTLGCLPCSWRGSYSVTTPCRATFVRNVSLDGQVFQGLVGGNLPCPLSAPPIPVDPVARDPYVLASLIAQRRRWAPRLFLAGRKGVLDWARHCESPDGCAPFAAGIVRGNRASARRPRGLGHSLGRSVSRSVHSWLCQSQRVAPHPTVVRRSYPAGSLRCWLPVAAYAGGGGEGSVHSFPYRRLWRKYRPGNQAPQ